MTKQNKRKGFALIEMMIVVAIIAILVAVVVPTVSNYTVKASAATNAANLRAIEGKLSTMRLMNPDDFKTMLDDQGRLASTITEAYVGILDLLYGKGYGEETLNKKYCQFTASDKGVLTLYAPNIVINNVPSAKKLEIQGSNKSNSIIIAEGTPMTVFISEENIVATYGVYTAENFADVAEDGKFDGKIEGGQTGGGGVAGTLCKMFGHKYNKDGICERCQYDRGWHDCYDDNGDIKCDNCGVCINDEHIDQKGHILGGPNGRCDRCNTEVEHTCNDEKNGIGQDKRNHECDICGDDMGGSCGAEYTYDDTYHYCKYCGANKGRHSDWIKGTQSNPRHTCKTCTYTGDCVQKSKWEKECKYCESTECITPDTLITLADGTQKRVDELTGNEMLLVWDHNTGKFAAAPVSYIIDHDKQIYEVEIMTLTFSDGNVVKIINEHVFFDADEGKYVAITSDNADSYIGHSFAAMSEGSNSLHMAQLLSVERTVEETEVYEVVTHRTLTCFTNNVLSASAYLDGLLNIFEIDVETMAYDAEAKAADLEKYGTSSYAFFAPFVSRDMFDMYNGEYMAVAMGKDVLSLRDILNLIDLHYLYVND